MARNGQPLARGTLEQNAILQGLDEAAASEILEHSKFLHLALRKQIYEPESKIDRVYFPLGCVLSVVTEMKDGTQIEVGTIGRPPSRCFWVHRLPQTTATAK